MPFHSCRAIIFWSYYTCFVPLYLLHKYISFNKNNQNLAEFYQNLDKAEHIKIIQEFRPNYFLYERK